jgi:methanogenic corrinoid protein MtbC1
LKLTEETHIDITPMAGNRNDWEEEGEEEETGEVHALLSLLVHTGVFSGDNVSLGSSVVLSGVDILKDDLAELFDAKMEGATMIITGVKPTGVGPDIYDIGTDVLRTAAEFEAYAENL